ncbi:MAG: hypothetical protein KDJ77_09315 [Rhodobiaceae bacterium]|nr:hypothetical protein [Rhodobiaceae bacterium]
MSVDMEQAKRLMLEQNALMIAAKAHGFANATLRAILQVGPVYSELSDVDREKIILEFEKQPAETAQRVMRFWRTRTKLSAA